MTSSVITIGGAANNLLLITDHEGTIHRMPIQGISVVSFDNDARKRIEIKAHGDSVVLLFDDNTDLNAALAIIDGVF